jgi:hypothetical protein
MRRQTGAWPVFCTILPSQNALPAAVVTISHPIYVFCRLIIHFIATLYIKDLSFRCISAPSVVSCELECTTVRFNGFPTAKDHPSLALYIKIASFLAYFPPKENDPVVSRTWTL